MYSHNRNEFPVKRDAPQYRSSLRKSSVSLPPLSAPKILDQGRGQHVLYLDDEEAMVFLMERLLQKRGFRVSGFTVAAEALAAVSANPGDFDLVVTDFNMPTTSGLDVARAIRAIRSDLTVVVTSGYISEELRGGAAAAGVEHVIFKPNSVEEMAALLVDLLEGKSD